jgi:hypothetical protein
MTRLFKQINIFSLLFILALTSLFSAPQAAAQSSDLNEINFRIPSVTRDGSKQSTTRLSDTAWEFTGGALDLDDGIRYSWQGVDIDLKYKDLPAEFGGYLKIYKDNDSREENFITDYGTYSTESVGLKLSELDEKLREGENTIMFVFIGYEDVRPVPKAKVKFTFEFENESSDPQIDILKPDPGAVLAQNIHQDFEIELTNFTLENSDSGEPNHGKMNVYYNEVTQSTQLGTITTSLEQDGKQKVRFNTEDFGDFNVIPDNQETQIIFVLTKNNGELLPFRKTIELTTNFENTLDIGLPKITILEPNRDRQDLEVDGDQKFLLQIDNFEISERELVDSENQKGKGYLQIILNDRPIELAFPKPEFTLNEIGASQFGEGSLTVKVQLVNYDYTKLNPEAHDSIEVFFVPQDGDEGTEVTQVENNTWRFVIMGLIVVLVVGSISILITRG